MKNNTTTIQSPTSPHAMPSPVPVSLSRHMGWCCWQSLALLVARCCMLLPMTSAMPVAFRAISIACG